jgi:hypothetical protein
LLSGLGGFCQSGACKAGNVLEAAKVSNSSDVNLILSIGFLTLALRHCTPRTCRYRFPSPSLSACSCLLYSLVVRISSRYLHHHYFSDGRFPTVVIKCCVNSNRRAKANANGRAMSESALAGVRPVRIPSNDNAQAARPPPMREQMGPPRSVPAALVPGQRG